MASPRARVEQIVLAECPHLAPTDAADAGPWVEFIVEEIMAGVHDIASERMLRNLIGDYLGQAALTASQEQKVPAVSRRIFQALLLIEGLLPKAKAAPTEEIDSEQGEVDADDEEENEKERIVLDMGCCVLCEREMALTLHHLIPREVHYWYLKHEGKSKVELHSGIMVCRDCHSAIHKFEDNKTLAAEYATLERLLAHEKMPAWINYIRKQRPTNKADRRTWKQWGRRDLPPTGDADDDSQ